MKKVLSLILLVFSLSFAFSQTYPVTQILGAPQTLVLSKGGLKADSSLIVPAFTDTSYANLSPYINKYPGNIIRVANQVFVRNADATKWLIFAQSGAVPGTVTSITQGYGITNTPNPIVGAGTIKVDTTSSTGLSGKYVRIADTSAMLSKYLRRSDTTAMLNPYLRKVDTASLSNRINLKQNVLGTSLPLRKQNDILSITQATYSSNGYIDSFQYREFLKKVDTIYRKSGKDSIYISANGLVYQIKDSVGGSINISQGYGIVNSPNPITNSGTITVDTATLSSKYVRASDTANKFVNRITRTPGIDSIYYYIGNTRYAIKDSSGGGGTVTRAVDTIYRVPGRDSIIFTIAGIRRAIKDSIGSGSGIVGNSSFGYFYDSTTQMLQDPNYRTQIKISKTDTAKGFHLDANRIVADSQGVYNLQWIGQFQNQETSEGVITIWIRKNGADVVGSAKKITISKKRNTDSVGNLVASWNYIMPMNVNDNVEWYWSATTKAISIQYYPQGTSPVTPSTSSVSVSITSVLGGGGGGGGGNPAGNNGYVQFNNSGSFGGDSSLFWNNTNKRLGIGTTQPRTKLDVALGKLGNMPYNYEIAAFEKNGDVKFGVYNADNYNGSGSSIILGNTKNVNANGNYPGFEFQNVNDSENINNSYVRYNYAERGTDGNSVAANINLLNIYANGTVQLNPFSFGLSVTPRLIIGDDITGATFDVSGNAYIGSGLVVDGPELTSYAPLRTNTSRYKSVIVLDDNDIGNTYYIQGDEHIIIYNTNLDNCEIYLPAYPDDGRELVIKKSGVNAAIYDLFVYGNGHDIWYGEVPESYLQISNNAPHSMTLIYNSGTGYWYQLTEN